VKKTTRKYTNFSERVYTNRSFLDGMFFLAVYMGVWHVV